MDLQRAYMDLLVIEAASKHGPAFKKVEEAARKDLQEIMDEDDEAVDARKEPKAVERKV